MRFGFNAIQSGQKSATVNALPRLTANSTLGKFVLTAPVSKAMNVAVGENIMFLNNIANLEAAIQAQDADLVAYCNENGIDLTTREGVDAVMEQLTVWAIAKGVPQVDSKNNPVMAKERYTKDDKQKYIDANADAILAANREALIERNGGVDADDETLKALITVDDIEAPEYRVHTGSKTATTGNSTGTGCQLNFTDTSIWNTLKKDLDEETRIKKNRVFDVLLDECFKTEVPNGYENVEVMAYPISFVADEDPIVREKKEAKEEA